MSWIERDVADEEHDGAVAAAAAHPKAVETVPSIPFAPRLDSTRGGVSRAAKNVSTSRTGIEDATRIVALPGSADRARRRRAARSARRRARSAIALAAARSARRQSSIQLRSGRIRNFAAIASSVRPGSVGMIVATAPAGSCQTFSGSNASCSASS